MPTVASKAMTLYRFCCGLKTIQTVYVRHWCLVDIQSPGSGVSVVKIILNFNSKLWSFDFNFSSNFNCWMISVLSSYSYEIISVIVSTFSLLFVRIIWVLVIAIQLPPTMHDSEWVDCTVQANAFQLLTFPLFNTQTANSKFASFQYLKLINIINSKSFGYWDAQKRVLTDFRICFLIFVSFYE